MKLKLGKEEIGAVIKTLNKDLEASQKGKGKKQRND